jgi:hypothetical protein
MQPPDLLASRELHELRPVSYLPRRQVREVAVLTSAGTLTMRPNREGVKGGRRAGRPTVESPGRLTLTAQLAGEDAVAPSFTGPLTSQHLPLRMPTQMLADIVCTAVVRRRLNRAKSIQRT